MQLADLDINKTYTYADYLTWTFMERVELIKGKIFKMSPAPSPLHQILLGRLYLDFGNFLRGNRCQVFLAPFDVRLTRKIAPDKEVATVVQPDLCVVCDPSKIDNKGCAAAPDLVVEILSPGNTVKELKSKYAVYEEAGVSEYWIVYPSYNQVQIHTLMDGKYAAPVIKMPGDIITTPILPGLEINVANLFDGL